MARMRRKFADVRDRKEARRLASDRQSYGLGNLQARLAQNRRAGKSDREGWNREVLAHNLGMPQFAVDSLMDYTQRELGDNTFTNQQLMALQGSMRALNAAKKNKEYINSMYLPTGDDDPMDEYSPIAHAIAYGDPVNVARYDSDNIDDYQGSIVSAGDLYGDPTYPMNTGTATSPWRNLETGLPQIEGKGRGNPFLKDLTYTTTGPQVTDDDFFMNIPGTGGQGMRRIGNTHDFLDKEGVNFAGDAGYKIINPNPTRYDWDNWKGLFHTMPEVAIGTYGYGPDTVQIDRSFGPNTMKDNPRMNPIGKMGIQIGADPTQYLYPWQGYNRGGIMSLKR